MASPAQILANRENAQHSTGPVTDQGKSASSKNSLKHGLSSAFTVLPNEDSSEYDEALNGFTDEFNPDGYHETFLVHQMVQARWRVIRIHRLERVYLERTQLNDPTSDPDHAILDGMAGKGIDILNALSRYAAAAERTYYRAHRELREGRRECAQQQTTDARRDTAEARRDIAETERAIAEFCNPPLPQLAAIRHHQALESKQPLASQVPSNSANKGPGGTTDFTHATRKNLRAPAV